MYIDVHEILKILKLCVPLIIRGRHSSVDPSAPIILRPGFESLGLHLRFDLPI